MEEGPPADRLRKSNLGGSYDISGRILVLALALLLSRSLFDHDSRASFGDGEGTEEAVESIHEGGRSAICSRRRARSDLNWYEVRVR